MRRSINQLKKDYQFKKCNIFFIKIYNNKDKNKLIKNIEDVNVTLVKRVIDAIANNLGISKETFKERLKFFDAKK